MYWLVCVLLALAGASLNVALWLVVIGGNKTTVLERGVDNELFKKEN